MRVFGPRRSLLAAALAAAVAASAAAPSSAAAAPRGKGRKATRAAAAARGPARAHAAPASSEPIAHGAGVGAVLHVTPVRAYLDVGALHGLAPGQDLRILRGGSAVAICEVEAVAPRHASCLLQGAGARRGDVVRVTPPAAPPAPKPLPRLVAADELDRRAAYVAELPVPKVEAKVKEAPVAVMATPRVDVSIGHGVWWSEGSRGWQQERADVTVRGADAFAGMKLYADLRAIRWTARPGTFRMRPADRSVLYLYEANLASRDPSRAWTLALGRVVPFGIPGSTTFDGVQLGLGSAGRAELGVFGGLVPDPSSTAPSADRSTAGAYAVYDHGQDWLVGREELRAALTTSPELGTRFEGEVRSLWLVGRHVNVEGDLRVGVGGQHQAQNAIDLAQVDVSGRPLPRIQLSGLFRYAGLSVPDVAAPALFRGAERRWDGSAGYDLGPAVLSVAGGQGRDLSTGLERWWVGPELSVPRAFGSRGGVSLGYAEERGWIGGRTAWAQAAVRAGERLRLSWRASWTADTRAGDDADHAVGLLAAASVDVARWFAVRGSVLARVGGRGADLLDSTGVTAMGSLVSRF